MTWWGTELQLDCGECDLASIKDADNIKAFAKELVEQIDMVAYGPPQVVHFGSEDKMGFTLVQLIETSNITAHFSEDTSSAFINVFSCKNFDTLTVKEVVKKYFKSKQILMNRINRYVPT